MCYLKLPYTIKFLALIYLSLLSACDQEQMIDGDNEPAISLESNTPAPAPSQGLTQPRPQVDTQPAAAELRSADSLNLTIKETPFRETSLIGSGTTTSADWLESESHAVDLNRMQANDNMLPDLFNKKEREKATSVEMEMHIDDGEQEITDVIDGAGLTIKHRTD